MAHAEGAECVFSDAGGCDVAEGHCTLRRDDEIRCLSELARIVTAGTQVDEDPWEDQLVLAAARLDAHLRLGKLAVPLNVRQGVAGQPIERVVAGREGLALGGAGRDLEADPLLAAAGQSLQHLHEQRGLGRVAVDGERRSATSVVGVLDLDVSRLDEAGEHIEGTG